jgi:hypothetical protein
MSADARLTLTVKAETASDAIKAALESPGIDPEAWFVVAVSCWNRATRIEHRPEGATDGLRGQSWPG